MNTQETASIQGADRRAGWARWARGAVGIALSVGLTGCVSRPLPGFGPQTPYAPTSRDLSITAKDAVADLGLDRGVTARQRLQISYNTTYRLCSAYFDNLIEIQNQTDYVGDVLAAGATMATAMTNLRRNASDAANSIARIAAGSAFANVLVSKFDDRALMTPYPTETKGLVLAALTAYEADIPASTIQDDAYVAQKHAMHYAELCTYSAITRFAKEALTAARPTAEDPGGDVPPRTPQVATDTGRAPPVIRISP